jgi:hypothetical protein
LLRDPEAEEAATVVVYDDASIRLFRGANSSSSIAPKLFKCELSRSLPCDARSEHPSAFYADAGIVE